MCLYDREKSSFYLTHGAGIRLFCFRMMITIKSGLFQCLFLFFIFTWKESLSFNSLFVLMICCRCCVVASCRETDWNGAWYWILNQTLLFAAKHSGWFDYLCHSSFIHKVTSSFNNKGEILFHLCVGLNRFQNISGQWGTTQVCGWVIEAFQHDFTGCINTFIFL